jgi:glyoxylase-like metal-dependent hydrolase (beta-lactamase superfamily II)
MKLLENLYCYIWQGRGNNSNSYLFAHVLRGDRPHVLIDPGHVVNELQERCLDNLLGSIGRDGLQPEDIGLIINTHSHPDHCEANQSLVERSRARTGKPKQTLIALHQDEEGYRRAWGGMMARMLGRGVAFEPNFYLKEGDLNLGKEKRLNLKVLHTPGHSPGSISLYWPDNRVLITGDVLFYGGVGRTDLSGGDGKLLRQSIERLSELDIEYLLPGHSTELGSIIKGSDKVRQNFAFVRLNYFPML